MGEDWETIYDQKWEIYASQVIEACVEGFYFYTFFVQGMAREREISDVQVLVTFVVVSVMVICDDVIERVTCVFSPVKVICVFSWERVICVFLPERVICVFSSQETVISKGRVMIYVF